MIAKRILIAILMIIPSLALADDVSIGVCRLGNSYQFSFTGDIDSWAIEGADTFDAQALTATGYGMKFTVYYGGASQSIYGYPDAEPCPKDEWKPGAPSIIIPAPAGIFKLEIQDAYGHWSLVTDAAHPDGIVLSPAGGNIELIGSVGQDTDPAHYRLIEVTP